MSEKYIVEGPALWKLLQENRIRVARGELRFTPLSIGDGKQAVPADTKQPPAPDVKKPRKARK